MFIVLQSLLIMLIIIFALGAIGDRDVKNRQLFATVLVVCIVALVIVYQVTV